MSNFDSIRAVSRSLRQLLVTEITQSPDPQLNGIAIDLRSPKELREDTNAASPVVSLWMYRLARNEHRVNQPPLRESTSRQRRLPLPVNLYYLVTPLAAASDDEQLLLGRVLQVFNDHPMLRGTLLHDSLQGATEELRLSLEPLSLEELTRVWDALKEPYELSVSYLVQVLDIDSAREPEEVPAVGVREAEYHQIEAVV